MELNTLWFILISVLFMGFFFLEGFDYGAMILMPFLGKKDVDRRILINTIGPVWDGNEVWLITAGGAMFAAFPNWYATMFSGFYLALFLILIALIFRGVAFEFRSKVESVKWRMCWDMALCVGSLIPALLFGVAMGNLIKGVPIDGNMEYVGNFFDLLSPFTLLVGLTGLAFFIYHGAVYITLKIKGDLLKKTEKLSRKLGIISLVAWVLLVIYSAIISVDAFKVPVILATLIATSALVASLIFLRKGKNGKALISNGVAIASAVAALFANLYPNVMVSSLDKAYNLTITNASSSPYTLKVMSIIALTMVPIVMIYQIWSYWVFRKRITGDKLEY